MLVSTGSNVTVCADMPCTLPLSWAKQQCLHGQEARQKRAAGLCNRFTRGECPFGEACKFNHDLAAYLQTKPADLPGLCPFTAFKECPYGEQSSHRQQSSSLTSASRSACRNRQL